MSGCLGPQSPPNRASCSHFSIPAPLTHLKAIPSSPLFLLQAPVFFPQELSASPQYAFYFSHRIQPIPALRHLFHSLPLQDHITTLSCCSCSLALLSLAPGPCLVASILHCFLWLLPYPLSLHSPGQHPLLTKQLSNHFGQCLDFTGSHPASPISREKNPHSAFPSPL